MDKLAFRLRLYCLAFSFLVSPLLGAELAPVVVDDFSPGLSSAEDPSKICPGCAQDLLNVDVENKAVEKRRGSVKQNSTPLCSFTGQPTKFIHEFVDSSANTWLLSVSSNTLFKSNDGGATNTIITSTHGITSASQFCGVNAYGKARLTDGTTNWILYDGSSISVSTNSPKGFTCEFFAERVWTSVGSLLYGSANGQPEDWTTNSGTDDDAFSTYIRQNDGYSVRAIKRFKSGLLVFKDYSLDYLTLNSDGLTFTQRAISNRIGTQYPKTIIERENDVIWMASDGYYSYDGAVIKRISDPIHDTFFSIKQLNSGSRSYGETSQSSFLAGTSYQVSPYITSGDILLSSFSAVDTSTSDFTLGTFSNTYTVALDTNTPATGIIKLSTNNTTIDNPGFESGTGTDADNWTEVSGSLSGYTRATSVLTHGGSWLAEGHYGIVNVSILDVSDSVLTSTEAACCSESYVQGSINLSAYVGRWIKIYFADSDTRYGGIKSDAFFCSGTTITYWTRYHASSNEIFVDDIADGRSTIFSGTLTSQSFNTALSSAAWGPSTPTYQTNGSSVTFQTQSSWDGVTWNTASAWVPGSSPTSVASKYIRYIVTLSTGGTTGGIALPYVTDVTINARANNGRYFSPAFPTTSATSWNAFTGSRDVSTGGNQTFEIYTDTDTTMSATDATSFVSSQTISNGAVPTVAINTYAHVGSTFSITDGAQNPSMQDFILSWNVGSSNFPAWSTYYQGNYFSSVAISSDTGNDRMLVYDKNGAWTLYSYPAYSLSLYRQQPYFGSNLQGDIVRFQADNIYQDFDSSAISAYWISKEFDFGLPLTYKTVNRYYVTAKYRANDEATFEWGVNRGTLTSESSMGTLDLDSTPGFFNKTIIPSSLTYKHGKSHRFKVSNSILGDRFDLLSVTIKADSETNP